MSERAPSRPEIDNARQEKLEVKTTPKETLEQLRMAAEKATSKKEEELSQLRKTVEKEAESQSARSMQQEDREPEAQSTYWFSKEYHQIAYQQLLRRVQRQLKPRQQVGSKIIHQQTVEKLAELGENTIARPSGVLVGSIVAFIASFVVYINARLNGYDMTYNIFITAFLGGFLIGVTIELVIKAVRSFLSRR